MSEPREDEDAARAAAKALAERAMRVVCVSLPHLTGLAHAVVLRPDARVATAGVTPGGRVLLNPTWFGALTLGEATFVLAHELLHLAFRHHERAAGANDPRLANIAQDAVINDILQAELGAPVPQGGIWIYGARERSFEEILIDVRDWLERNPEMWDRSWWDDTPKPAPTSGSMAAALADAGLVAPEGPGAAAAGEMDLLDAALEAELFPDAPPPNPRALIEDLAKQALAAGAMQQAVREQVEGWGRLPGGRTAIQEALATSYRPPWELALQRWTETIAPGRRSWSRPSRRTADPSQVLRPGRLREGWTLNIVLDTSGSMSSTLAAILGVIGSFCRAARVADVRVLQCDTEVTVDERVDPDELAAYRIAGYGGSDMGPAMERLSGDAEVVAAIVITDGWIDYPQRPPPYEVLWALTTPGRRFHPPYGTVLSIHQALR